MGVSVIIPAYNEGERIGQHLDKLFSVLAEDVEVIVVYDSPEDSTAPPLTNYQAHESRLVPLLNTYGKGPGNALRFAFERARGSVTVVTMADDSDDVDQIPDLVRMIEKGAVVAAASRYLKGGRQIGGPRLKRALSRFAGVSLYHLGRVGTHDATNSFKAYSTDFVRSVRIESNSGFEMGIEMVAKARRARCPVAEIPTTWRDRTSGKSRFRLLRWAPKYLRWYLHAFGPRRPLPGSAG